MRLNKTITDTRPTFTTQFAFTFYAFWGKFCMILKIPFPFLSSSFVFELNIKTCVAKSERRKSNIIQYVDFLIVISSNSIFLLRFSSSHFSADHGKVLKTINAASADDSSKVSSVVIEELDVLAKPEPIRNLKIVRTMQYGEFDVSL
jgi:hypothetical protein